MNVSFFLRGKQLVIKIASDEKNDEYIVNAHVEVQDNKIVNKDEIREIFTTVLNAWREEIEQGRTLTQEEVNDLVAKLH